MSNIGTNTHAQIDTFISSEGQASGLATLDSTSKLTSSQIPTLNLGSNLSDCVITSPVSGQSLVYNGGPIHYILLVIHLLEEWKLQLQHHIL